MDSAVCTRDGETFDEPTAEVVGFLDALAGLQQRYVSDAAALIAEHQLDALFTQVAALHLSLTARLFASQAPLLRGVADIGREVDAIESGAWQPEVSPTDEWLDEVFPGLLTGDRAARQRLESLFDEIRPDGVALLEFASMLDDQRAVRVSGRAEHDAVSGLIDDLWCATRSLRRAVLDDAHARAVLLDRTQRLLATTVESPAAETAPDAETETDVAVAAALRDATPAELRRTLGSLIEQLAPAASITTVIEPVTDEPIFRFDTNDERFELVLPVVDEPARAFWPTEPLVRDGRWSRRARNWWPTTRTPQVQVTT